jgi:hypothetical protein
MKSQLSPRAEDREKNQDMIIKTLETKLQNFITARAERAVLNYLSLLAKRRISWAEDRTDNSMAQRNGKQCLEEWMKQTKIFHLSIMYISTH